MSQELDPKKHIDPETIIRRNLDRPGLKAELVTSDLESKPKGWHGVSGAWYATLAEMRVAGDDPDQKFKKIRDIDLKLLYKDTGGRDYYLVERVRKFYERHHGEKLTK